MTHKYMYIYTMHTHMHTVSNERCYQIEYFFIVINFMLDWISNSSQYIQTILCTERHPFILWGFFRLMLSAGNFQGKISFGNKRFRYIIWFKTWINNVLKMPQFFAIQPSSSSSFLWLQVKSFQECFRQIILYTYTMYSRTHQNNVWLFFVLICITVYVKKEVFREECIVCPNLSLSKKK